MGVRDIIAHHYFDVDIDVIYQIIHDDLTPGGDISGEFRLLLCQEITKLLLGKDGLLVLDFAESHIPYGSDSSDSSDSSKLGGIWRTGRKNIVINIF